jgi:hypothetical protein
VQWDSGRVQSLQPAQGSTRKKVKGKNMTTEFKKGSLYLAAFCLAMTAACSKPRQPEGVTLKQMPAGKEYSGFLSTYANLKLNPNFENTMSYVNPNKDKDIHRYFAVIIEPVQLYVSTNADVSKFPDRGRTALAAYFEHAIRGAVEDAFPVMTEQGPLVLRLRTALVGVDVGGETGGAKDKKDKDDPTLERMVNIGKVGVEMELVDSVTGEQIAAAVDRESLGAGAEVGSANFSRDEKFEAAREAFDGWAARLRRFLDSAHELSKEDAARADASYHPYGEPAAAKE